MRSSSKGKTAAEAKAAMADFYFPLPSSQEPLRSEQEHEKPCSWELVKEVEDEEKAIIQLAEEAEGGVSARGEASFLYEDESRFSTSTKKEAVGVQVDWAVTKLFSMVVRDEVEFNAEGDSRCFSLEEVLYVVKMLQLGSEEFRHTDTLRGLRKKTLFTLGALLHEMDLMGVHEMFKLKFAEDTPDDVLSLLL